MELSRNEGCESYKSTFYKQSGDYSLILSCRHLLLLSSQDTSILVFVAHLELNIRFVLAK